MSIRIASRLRAVSTSVSPLLTLEPDDATLTVSADSRFSANSKEMRVRVDASKKRLTIVCPRSAGTFLIARSLISLNGTGGVEHELDLVGRKRFEIEQVLAECARHVRSARTTTTASRPSSSSTSTSTRSPVLDRELLPDDVGVDRQLAPAAIDQHRERHARRAPEVRELVERRAHGAARVEHVVDDHDALAVEIPRQVGGPDHGARADCLQVVAVERDVEGAARDLHLLALVDRANDAVRELNAAALDADDDQVIRSIVQLDDLFGHAAERPVNRARVEQGRIVSCHRPAIWRRRDPE